MGGPVAVEGDARPVPSAVLAVKLDALTEAQRDTAAEVRLLRAELVRRDVYEATRAGDLARIASLEAAQSRQGDRRWQLVAMLVAAGLSVVATVTSTIIVAVAMTGQ